MKPAAVDSVTSADGLALSETGAMRRALDLAQAGWGRVHPNPMVGAVVLAGDRVVAQGYHAEYGGPHAERAALEEAGDRARGGTLVVTLEPCVHQGKQPPCVEAVIASGVRRVIVAGRDPNPEARGGVEALRAAGIEVEVGALAPEAGALNAAFYHRHRGTSRPWVALKLATSVDYRIADHAGRASWVSGPAARDWVHWLRAGFDGIAVGAGTLRADDPQLTVRGTISPRRPPRRVVFSRSGDFPAGAALVRDTGDAPTVLVTVRDGEPGVATEDGVTRVTAPSLVSAFEWLYADGVTSVLVEGGGGLAGSLLAEGLVDRFYWVQSPLWLGADGTPATPDLPSHALGEAHRWTVVERRPLAADTLLVLDRSPCSPA